MTGFPAEHQAAIETAVNWWQTRLFDTYARLACRRALYRFHKGLYYAGARGMGLFNSKNFHLSGEEMFQRRFLAQPEFEVVFDVGANVGDFARCVLEANPSCIVHAFEPHPRTFRKLEKHASSRLTVHECALGAGAGSLILYDVAAQDGSQLASVYEKAIAAHTESASRHEVVVRTLDDVVVSSGVSRIDLLKIDTEGHERAVLEGARRSIEQGRIRSVLFEFNEMNVFSRTFMRDFMDLLPGFRFFRLLTDGLIPLEPYSPFVCEIFAFQNVWAVRTDLASAFELSR